MKARRARRTPAAGRRSGYHGRPMATTFAALIFRPAEIPDRALSQGFAVALGGWDVASPRLFIAPLPGVPGYSAAFYSSGEPAGGGDDELDHLSELFEDELSPPVAVLDAAAELGHPGATVFALVFSEDVVHDDGWRFEASGFVRHFVREGRRASGGRGGARPERRRRGRRRPA